MYLAVQVMNVSLAEGDTVRFEDLGGREPSVLANESILMRGLVVRSWSNQISIHFHSQQPKPGSFLLRYQGKTTLLYQGRHSKMQKHKYVLVESSVENSIYHNNSSETDM